ncbi:hypothetical protein KSP40_PGU006574 [Platanthera guangdongensis]|uniref:Uncharacterized protein n=1 Tax=Platanthera guangdongensis TaxID=2320717 RepID=A0ABR2MSU3_9ASPA
MEGRYLVGGFLAKKAYDSPSWATHLNPIPSFCYCKILFSGIRRSGEEFVRKERLGQEKENHGIVRDREREEGREQERNSLIYSMHKCSFYNYKRPQRFTKHG